MNALIEVTDLEVTFRGAWPNRGTSVRAVDGVNLTIERGDCLGIVGESGCGKSTLGRVVLRLIPPGAGQIRFNGDDPFGLYGDRLLAFRRRVQAVFQDSEASLDPRHTVGRAVREGLDIHRVGSSTERENRVRAMLERVGLAASYLDRYPHTLSGGQRQRVNIARALALRPDVLLADEPVSALDVSIQAQILELLADLRAEYGLTLLFISHDLAVVRELCDRVAVMYAGRIVEQGPLENVFSDPAHPYTQLLLASALRPDPEQTLFAPPAMPVSRKESNGCPFAPRCPRAAPECWEIRPFSAEFGPSREVACHHAGERVFAPSEPTTVSKAYRL